MDHLPTSFQHYLLGLFAVANNIPALGMFLAICAGLTVKEQRKLGNVATFTGLVTMTCTLLTGMAILNFFDISIAAFRIAGGILLLISGMNMLQSSPTDESVETHTYSKVFSVAIVPIGIPLTTGAGTISTVILFSSTITGMNGYISLFACIVLVSLFNFLLFRYAGKLNELLGKVGMNVAIKVMGLFTLAIGIQFLISGMLQAFPALK